MKLSSIDDDIINIRERSPEEVAMRRHQFQFMRSLHSKIK
jgi:hypothetical protein